MHVWESRGRDTVVSVHAAGVDSEPSRVHLTWHLHDRWTASHEGGVEMVSLLEMRGSDDELEIVSA
jgi:hypothetical protein